MKKKNIKIATILPYKENYTRAKASAASLWVAEFFKKSKYNKTNHIYGHTKNRDYALKGDDPLLHFIQRLRDESHRFAITSHRAKRSKNAVKSVFEELNGIGPTRKKILIRHFGSIEKIKNASLKELKEVKSIPIKILSEIYEFFHSV